MSFTKDTQGHNIFYGSKVSNLPEILVYHTYFFSLHCQHQVKPPLSSAEKPAERNLI